MALEAPTGLPSKTALVIDADVQLCAWGLTRERAPVSAGISGRVLGDAEEILEKMAWPRLAPQCGLDLEQQHHLEAC